MEKSVHLSRKNYQQARMTHSYIQWRETFETWIVSCTNSEPLLREWEEEPWTGSICMCGPWDD